MNDAQSQECVIKADKRARMLFIIAWIVCVCVGVALIRWALPWGQGQLEQAEPATTLLAIQIAIGLIFLSTIPFSVYLFRLGLRTVRCRQMPPPGTRVIKDTKVLEGDKAVTRGWLMMAIALVLIALGLAGGLCLPYKIGKAFGEQIRQPAPQEKQAETQGWGLPHHDP
jgi:UDP-N-acetylmuramyl pentapeptide phosphotransferase/UDP-N-acetylglucosamine-1-phosphate transferase